MNLYRSHIFTRMFPCKICEGTGCAGCRAEEAFKLERRKRRMRIGMERRILLRQLTQVKAEAKALEDRLAAFRDED